LLYPWLSGGSSMQVKSRAASTPSWARWSGPQGRKGGWARSCAHPATHLFMSSTIAIIKSGYCILFVLVHIFCFSASLMSPSLKSG
jgi:hypothetical protein